MRFITPEERLKINSMEEADLMKSLPSVVIIQRTRNDQNEERAYLVENRDWEEYVRLVGSVLDTVDIKEEAAKKLGYPIEVNAFESSTAYQLSCRHFLDESAYSIFATKFKCKPQATCIL